MASSLDGVRATRMRLSPLLAKASANTFPIPSEAPVISVYFFMALKLSRPRLLGEGVDFMAHPKARRNGQSEKSRQRLAKKPIACGHFFMTPELSQKLLGPVHMIDDVVTDDEIKLVRGKLGGFQGSEGMGLAK